MKKQAICILCHNKPEQVNQLIDFFPAEYFDFFIHVDKKSDIQDMIKHQANVKFAEQILIKWSHISQVKSYIAMFRMIEPEKYSYIHLISGIDFPVKNAEYFIRFFDNNQREYIECNALPEDSTWTWGGKTDIRFGILNG